MKCALFVNPPMLCGTRLKKEGTATIRPNVSIPALLILGELKKAGFKTAFISMAAEGFENVTKAGNLRYFGLEEKWLFSKILKTKPDFILVESMFASNFEAVKRTILAVKRKFPKIKVIAGGGFATQRPEWHIKDCKADFVIIGEGEKTTAKLIHAILNNNNIQSIKGIVFKKGNRIIKTKPAKASKEFNPAFDYEAVLFKDNGEFRYPETLTEKSQLYKSKKNNNKRACAFYGSKGCPIGCDYCNAQSKDGCSIKHMGGKKLFEQIKLLHETYGVNVFYNQADSFGLHTEDKKFLKYLAKYRKKHPELTLSNPNAFFLSLFLRKEKINRWFVRLLKKAGFNVITLAIETFNQRFSKKIDFSKISFEKIKQLCKFIRSQNLKLDIYMSYGFPGETIDELRNDLRKAEELSALADRISWGCIILFPGSTYYKTAVKNKWFTEKQYKKEISKGYFSETASNSFNFTKIPTKKLKEIFKNK